MPTTKTVISSAAHTPSGVVWIVIPRIRSDLGAKKRIMKGVRYGAEICVCDFWVGLGVGSGNHKIRRPSYSHRHHDIAVLVILAIGGAELAGGLGVLKLQLYFSGADSFQKIQNILRVEADGEGVAVVVGFEGVFGLAAFGGGG